MKILKFSPFLTVAANTMATLDLKQYFGHVYHRIILTLGGTSFTKAMISEVRIKANGKIIFQDSGSRIDTINQYRGLTANANQLTIDFTEPFIKDQLSQLAGGLDTGLDGQTPPQPKLNSLIMEVDIGAATAPTLSATLDAGYQDTQVNQLVDLIGKRLLFTFPVAGSGAKIPLPIPFGPQGGTLIKRIHFFILNGTMTINGVTINKDSAPIFDTIASVNQFIQTEFKRVPQAGVFTVDFIVDGNMNANILNAANAKSMEYYADITVTAGGNVLAVVEMLDPLANN